MQSIFSAITSLAGSGLGATVIGAALATVAGIVTFYANRAQKKAAKLAALAVQRWPVIDLALSTIERQADEAVKDMAGGRYLPVYEVAKQLFTEEEFEFNDVVVMADFLAKEFSTVKYEKFLAKDSANVLQISETERQLGGKVAASVLAAVNKDVESIQFYKKEA